jgi:glycosyltransferase involved in cell wall biosynthesis
MIVRLIRALRPYGMHFSVACLTKVGELGEALRAEGVPVHLLRNPLHGPLSIVHPKLIRYLRWAHVDVVHAHSGTWLRAALSARLAGRLPVVFTDHGRALPERTRQIWYDRLAGRWTRVVAAVSPSLSGYLLQQVGIPSDRFMIVENGVPLAESSSNGPRPPGLPARGPLVGCVARLEWPKDHETLIRAMEQVKRRVPETQLLLIGGGPSAVVQRLKALAGALGLEKHVHFLGTRDDVSLILPHLRLFVLPTLSEGTSLSILEAMAAGVPVVASRVGGNPSVVDDGNTGILVSPRDAQELAIAMVDLLVHSEKALRMGASGRDRVCQRFNLQAMAQTYRKLYGALVVDSTQGRIGRCSQL